jgi:signal peptidase I
LRRIGFALALLFAGFIASSAIWRPFWLPAGSMKPTLLVGDYVIAVPVTGDVQRGDVVVFTHPVRSTEFVKRVIGLPGDSIEMKQGQVILNGTALPQEDLGLFQEVMAPQGAHGALPMCMNGPVAQGEACEKRRLRETLPNGRFHDILDVGQRRLDDTALFEVPQGHIFVLGDNRDNSLDSRVAQQVGGVGFVPLENVTYRMWRVAFSMAAPGQRIWVAVE